MTRLIYHTFRLITITITTFFGFCGNSERLKTPFSKSRIRISDFLYFFTCGASEITFLCSSFCSLGAMTTWQ